MQILRVSYLNYTLNIVVTVHVSPFFNFFTFCIIIILLLLLDSLELLK